MLEYHCKNNQHLVVQRKKRKIGGRKKAGVENKTGRSFPSEIVLEGIKRIERKMSPCVSAPKPRNTGPTPEELEALWDTVSGELSAIFQARGELPENVAPFDAASEVDVDQQR